MKKKFIYFLQSTLILLLFATSANAQSKAAYLKAGKKCLEKNDPFSAINHFREALTYGTDPELAFQMALAEKSLHNYPKALEWSEKCVAETKDSAELKSAILLSADLLKRIGKLEASIQQLSKCKYCGDSISSMIQAYREVQVRNIDSLPLLVEPMPQDINSAYSDFAPTALGDSILYFSSLRYLPNGEQINFASSRIASSNQGQTTKKNISVLPGTINQESFNNANASISPDGKRMIFTRCLYNAEDKLICALYSSRYESGTWTEAVRIGGELNKEGFTFTQPCISSRGAEGYLLFFSSDMPGGLGGMDIWYCNVDGGRFGKPLNAGKSINSSGDEWSPFYDAESDSLYFSSERFNSTGGLDIYAKKWSDLTSSAKPLSPPLNSGYNDLYFTRSYGPLKNRFLVSNRPPAMKLNGSSCCYDIFSIKTDSIKISRDSSTIAEASGSDKEPSKLTNSAFEKLEQEQKLRLIKRHFPIRMYFDNDYPDPRSRKTTTNQSVDQLAENYIEKQAVFIEKQDGETEKVALSAFFRDTVFFHLKKLELFSEQLLLTLQSENCILRMTVKGTASPLAESRYNLILSERRINSLKNYWMKWKEGAIFEMIQKGRLMIEFRPAGESGSGNNISDDLRDQRRSVYSLEASLERRIEIVDIEVVK